MAMQYEGAVWRFGDGPFDRASDIADPDGDPKARDDGILADQMDHQRPPLPYPPLHHFGGYHPSLGPFHPGPFAAAPLPLYYAAGPYMSRAGDPTLVARRHFQDDRLGDGPRREVASPSLLSSSQSPSLSSSSSTDRSSVSSGPIMGSPVHSSPQPPPHHHALPPPYSSAPRAPYYGEPGGHYPYYSHGRDTQPPPPAPPHGYPYHPGPPQARYGFQNGAAHHYTPSGVPSHASPPAHHAHVQPPSARDVHPPPQVQMVQPSYEVMHTDDAATKLSEKVRRRCFNCCTTETSTWRRSSLNPGKVLCNKCGLFERTHSRPRPDQFPHKRGPLSGASLKSKSPPPVHPPHTHVQSHSSNGHGHGHSHNRLPPIAPQVAVQPLPPHHYDHPSLAPLRSRAAESAKPGARANANTDPLPGINAWLDKPPSPGGVSGSSSAGARSPPKKSASPRDVRDHAHSHSHSPSARHPSASPSLKHTPSPLSAQRSPLGTHTSSAHGSPLLGHGASSAHGSPALATRSPPSAHPKTSPPP